MKPYKIIQFIATAFVFFSLSTAQAVAESPFSIQSKVTYDFTNKKTKSALVKHTYSITNLSQESVLTEQVLDSGFPNIKNVSVNFSKETEAEVIKSDGNSSIRIVFKDPIIGEKNSYSYTVNFETEDAFSESGLIKEIYLPKIKNSQEIKTQSVQIYVPIKFGQPNYVSPKPASITKEKDSYILSFDDTLDLKTGIAAFFGDFQLFSFELSYFLKNESPLKKTMRVAIPPDIRKRQTVYVKSIDPKPKNVIMDEDGNYIALYSIEGGKTANITISGIVKVFNKSPDLSSSGFVKDIKGMNKELTEKKEFWESDDEEIINIARSLISDNESVVHNAKKIYDYVVSTLSYNYDKTESLISERYGAKKALKNPDNSVCMEFTDLTIALLRAVGIPAREIVGYAYSKNSSKTPLSVFYESKKDFLHTWVEFYDPKIGWVQIDPTWGHTSKLDYFSNIDTNHLAFVRKGVSSLEPLPPGAYREINDKRKMIDVRLADKNVLKIKNTTPFKVINKTANSTIINESGITLYNLILKSGNKEEEIDLILPFGSIQTPLTGIEKIKYEDFDGNIKHVQVQITTKKGFINSSAWIFLGIFSALTLSLISFLLLKKVRPRKK